MAIRPPSGQFWPGFAQEPERVFGLIEGQTYGWLTSKRRLDLLGWPSGVVSPVVVAVAIAILSLAAFVMIERARLRAGRLVVVDLRLFSIASFSRGNVAALIVALGEFGLLFVLPLYLQGALGLSAVATGAVLIPLAVVTAQLAPRIGPRGVVQLGLALEVLGIGALGLALGSDTAVAALIPWLFIYGVGVGFATAQLTGVILTDVPIAASGQGSGIQSTFRQVGSALGIAILGTILITTLGSQLRDELRAVPDLPTVRRAGIREAVRASGGSAIAGLRAQARSGPVVAASERALSSSARLVAFTAAGFVLIGLLVTVGLPNPRNARADASRSPADTPFA